MSLLQRLDRLDAWVIGGLADKVGIPRAFSLTSATARELWDALPSEGQRRLQREASMAMEMSDPRDALIVSELQADLARWRKRGYAFGLVLVVVIVVAVMLVSDGSRVIVAGPLAGTYLGASWGLRRLRRAQQVNARTARDAGLR